jgi:hypothetical protein
MPDALVPFLIGVAVLVVYLVFSALTEMGTKMPQFLKKNRQ